MVTVGIDPHKNMHQAVALAQDGTRLGAAKKVTTGPEALGKLLSWIRALAGDAPVLWAIEGGPGLGRAIADALLGAGQEVVWVPARAMAAHRRLSGATGAKSDVIDAVGAFGTRSDGGLEEALSLLMLHLEETVETARPGETHLVPARGGFDSLREPPG